MESAPSGVPYSLLPTVSQTTKLESILNPTKFNGNHTMLRTFVAQLRLKIIGNSNSFPAVAHQLIYTTGRLNSTTLEQIMFYITSTGVNFANLKALITFLESAFQDPDRIATVEGEYERLQQRNSDFSAYYTDFQRITAQPSWKVQVKRHILAQDLSNKINKNLVHMNVLNDFDQYVALL